MAPSTTIAETETVTEAPPVPVKTQIVWRNAIGFLVMHVFAVYGLYLTSWKLCLHTFFWIYAASLGVTGGAHRLWSHRGYKAKLPLRIFLMLLNTVAMQNDIFIWSRDHRMHHKYTDTNADPHNSKRGFFFCHMGWLMVKKHPDVISKGKNIDVSDLLADPVVRFQRKYFYWLVLLVSFIIPTYIPVLWWGEDVLASFLAVFTRYVLELHGTWLVNSAAHMWGYKPYDKSITPTENLFVSFIGIGEGFHNYHHTFPFDYATSEYGWGLNFTAFFIDFMALLGQSYDRKSVSREAIANRKLRAIAEEKKHQ